MGKFLALCVALFLGCAGAIYVFGAPQTEGHGVDPAKAADAAGKAADLTEQYGKPWYDYVSAQAWFGAAVIGIAGMLVINRIWRGMNVTAKIGVSVVLTALVITFLVGIAR